MNDIYYTTELVIENGDFVVQESENQHIEHILRANEGDYLQYPKSGAGVNIKILNSSLNSIELRKKIKRGLEDDGYKLTDFEVNQNGVFIAAE